MRDYPLGQNASEWSSDGFFLQPIAFTDDAMSRTAASVLVNAVSVTALTADMRVISDSIDQAIEPLDNSYRIRGSRFEYHASHVDIATGLRARRLFDSEPALAEIESMLRAEHRVVDGADYLGQPPSSDANVLVLGGGPTAAWCALEAIKSGASHVDWVAIRKDPKKERGGEGSHEAGCEEKFERVKGILQKMADLRAKAPLPRGRRIGSPFAKRRDRLVALARDLSCFWQALIVDKEKNECGSAFSLPNIHRLEGRATRVEAAEGGGVRVFLAHRGGENGATVSSRCYDRVVVCIGHTIRARGGAAALCGRIPLQPSYVDDKNGRDGQRLVALEGAGAHRGRLRILGAAVYQTEYSDQMSRGELLRYSAHVADQSREPQTPAASAGVAGSIYQAARDIPLANAALALDKRLP
jgi:hypothetical protein